MAVSIPNTPLCHSCLSSSSVTGSFFFCFAFKPTPARVPSFISASNIRLKIANLMRKRENFGAISLSLKYQKAPFSNNANSRTFCLKSPRDWTRWLGSLPPWIGECCMTVWYNVFGGYGSLEHFATPWTNLDNQQLSVNASISVMGLVSGWTLSNSCS